MNILSVHNRYLYRGGEDESRELENCLLRSHGHGVFEYVADNHDFGRQGPLGIGLRSIWNQQAYRSIRSVIRTNHISLVKVDNFFPQISPAVFYAAGAEGIPTVQALRNFRLLCPGATFFRNGRVCEDCLGKAFPWPGISHGCYRQSRTSSIAPALMASTHRMAGTWSSRVTAYVALSAFSKDKFIQGGFSETNIFIKPNFVNDSGVGPGDGDFALFVGRLSPEKGIGVLLSAWRQLGGRLRLKIVGAGPMESLVRDVAATNVGIDFLGKLPLSAAYDLMGKARALIFPSEWYETFGRTVAEAFAKGTPVIASNLGTMQRMVCHQKTGLHFEAGNATALAQQVVWMLENPEAWQEMRAEARHEYESHYSPERNYERMMEIYHWAKDQCAPNANWN